MDIRDRSRDEALPYERHNPYPKRNNGKLILVLVVVGALSLMAWFVLRTNTPAQAADEAVNTVAQPDGNSPQQPATPTPTRGQGGALVPIEVTRIVEIVETVPVPIEVTRIVEIVETVPVPIEVTRIVINDRPQPVEVPIEVTRIVVIDRPVEVTRVVTATPSPTPSPTGTPASSPTPSPTGTPASSPTPSPTPSPMGTPASSPTVKP